MSNIGDGIMERKHIMIVFEDGKEHISKKTGKCTSNTEFEITLDNKHIIPKSRIIRIEILGDI